MGWVTLLLSVVAAVLNYLTEHSNLMWIALVAAAGCLWSWGVMHNYAVRAARRRPGYTGRFYDFSHNEVQSIPNWISQINMLFSLLGLAMLVCGIIFLF